MAAGETCVRHMPRGSDPKSEPVEHPARLFRDGRNQAVRIPRAPELAADEVVICREDRSLVMEPVERRPSLTEVLVRLRPPDEDFPDIDDPPSTPEAPL